MPFEFFPNTNFHDLNLDYLLGKAQKIDDNLAESNDAAQRAADSANAAADSETNAHNSELAAAGSEDAAKYYADHIADPINGIVTAWLNANITQETGYVLDSSLTNPAAAAPAKTVGDKALLNYGSITAAGYPDANNFPPHSICFCPSGEAIANLPDVGGGQFSGVVMTLKTGTNLGMQIAISNSGTYSTYFGKLFWRNCTGGTWWDWQSTVSDATFSSTHQTVSAKDIGVHALLDMFTMVTNATRLEALTGGSHDLNDLPVNRIIVIGATISDLVNYPSLNRSDPSPSDAQGVYITTGMNGAVGSGNGQLFIGYNFIAWRWRTSGGYGPWRVSQYDEQVYYVGPTRTYTSLTALCQSLSSNVSHKIIYLDPGEYDIYQEYRDAGIPTPPDNVPAGDYLTRVVFLPRNTKLVGLGNVTLKFMPAAGDITVGEANTWSPLNLRYACEIENITIEVENGRYCIHDDSHNDSSDQGVSHVFRNVRCIYHQSSKGFNNVTGFGFSSRNTYLFENCQFIFDGTGAYHAFYGHGASGSTLNIKNSPNITFNNCVFKASNGNAIRLQNLATTGLDIKTTINSCYLDGDLRFENYTAGAVQGFEVMLLKSGSPNITHNSYVVNMIYTPVIYT